MCVFENERGESKKIRFTEDMHTLKEAYDHMSPVWASHPVNSSAITYYEPPLPEPFEPSINMEAAEPDAQQQLRDAQTRPAQMGCMSWRVPPAPPSACQDGPKSL